MQKYVYTLCFLTGTPMLVGAGSIISTSELENIQKMADKNEDSIILQDGTALSGTLKNIPQLTYSFGNIPINIKDVAVIAFSPKSEKNKIQIVTRDGLSYIADLPNENFVVIQYLPNRKNPKYTINKEIAPASIRYITLREKEVNYATPRKRLFDIQMKNGDHIPAAITNESIVLSTGLRDEKIKTDDLLKLEVDFGIHGFTKNKQGQQVEFDYTYAKDKFLDLQIAQTPQTLGLPWSLVSKIQRIEPKNLTISTKRQAPEVEETISFKEELPRVTTSSDTGAKQALQLASQFDQEVDSLQKLLSEKEENVKNLEKELEKAQAAIIELKNKPEQPSSSKAELDELLAALKAEKQNSQTLQKNMEEIHARYKDADQKAQNFQKEIQSHIATRESLQKEFDALSSQLAEQNKNPTNMRLKSEIAKTKALTEQINNLQKRLETNEESTHQLIAKFEEEVKSLQLLLSGKQREVQFSEKELEKTLQDISQWRKAKRENVYTNQPIETTSVEIEEIEEQLLHPIHLLSDIDQLSVALEVERNNAIALQQSLDETLERYKKEELRAKSLQDEFKRQLSVQDSLEDKYLNHRTELENKIAQLQQSFEELQQELEEKEENIAVLKAAREEMIFTVVEAEDPMTHNPSQHNEEHQKHLISEIELLSAALDKERESVSILQNNITELQARVAEQEQIRSAQREESLAELENRIAMLQKSLDHGQMQHSEQEQTIQNLAQEKDDLLKTLATERNNLSELQARFADAEQRNVSVTQDTTENLVVHSVHESIILLLQQNLDERQRQLSEKEETIQALSTTKEELNNMLAAERQNLNELQTKLAEIEQKRASESEESAAKSAAHSELELKVSLLEKFLEEEHKQLTEKEEMIQTLSTTKEDLLSIFAAERNKLTGQVKENQEHKLHLISDIDALAVALEWEKQNTMLLKQNLEELNARLQEEQQHQASQLEQQENHMASRGAVEDNFYSEIEALDSLVLEKQQLIDRLESELRETANAHHAHRTESEQNLANLIQALEQEKSNLAKKENELLEAREKHTSLSQFADNLQNQIQALTQRSSSFGEEFAQTQKALNETQNENNALHEVNQYLHLQIALKEKQLAEQEEQHRQAVLRQQQEGHITSQGALEDNFYSEIEALDSLVLEKQQHIDQLENELRAATQANQTHHAHRSELEQNLANLMQALEQEKINLAKKELELLEAREKQLSLSQFAGNLEKQIQALTQKSSSFGDEFAQTQKTLEETKKEYKALLEINKHLHQQAALNEEKLLEQVQQNNQLQEHVIALTNQAKELSKIEVQMIQKIAIAESAISSLTTETEAYEELNRLGDGVSNLQEMRTLVKTYENELLQARKGQEELAHQLEQEKQTAEEMNGMIERLSEIVKIQKNALERIEQSQIVLKEEN